MKPVKESNQMKTKPVSKQPLTASAIIKEVRRLAREYPKAVYCPPKGGEACYNTKGVVKDGPKQRGCIIGQACANLRAKKNALKEYDSCGAFGLLDGLGIECSQEQIKWLHCVQARQDSRKSWGRAVREANSEHKGVR